MAKKKSHSNKLIRIDNAISILRVSPQQFQSWHKEGRFKILLNKNGKHCISENDLKSIAYSDEKLKASYEALLNYLERRVDNDITNQNSIFEAGIKNNVKKYRNYIKVIETIHANYSNRIDLARDESALAAAYALHAKVLNLLNMACFNIENHFWYSSLLLRPIDEAIDLAEYFIIKDHTEIGKKHLKVWFRENKSPSHSTCRKTISEFMGSFFSSGVTEIHKETLSDLYGLKSKPVHPTFNEIMMVLFNPKIKNRKILSTSFDYGPCTNMRELFELSNFFQSSIWSTVQGFFFCFQDKMPLSEPDKATLISYNKQFEIEAD